MNHKWQKLFFFFLNFFQSFFFFLATWFVGSKFPNQRLNLCALQWRQNPTTREFPVIFFLGGKKKKTFFHSHVCINITQQISWWVTLSFLSIFTFAVKWWSFHITATCHHMLTTLTIFKINKGQLYSADVIHTTCISEIYFKIIV